MEHQTFIFFMRNPYQNDLQKSKVLLNMTINGNNDNTPNILNTSKYNKIIYLGDIITSKSNIISDFYYWKNR